MTAIFIGILILFHMAVFFGSCYVIYKLVKKDTLQISDVKLVGILTLVISIIGFFGANHFAFLGQGADLMLAIGYSAFPVSQIVCLFLSYPVTLLFFKKTKYTAVFFSIVMSAPLSFLWVSLLGGVYWELLGKSIYGN